MSFYMIHEVVLIYITQAIVGESEEDDGDDEEQKSMGIQGWTVIFVVVAVSLLLGWLLTDYVESPMQKVILRTCLPPKKVTDGNSVSNAQGDSLEVLIMSREDTDVNPDRRSGGDSPPQLTSPVGSIDISQVTSSPLSLWR